MKSLSLRSLLLVAVAGVAAIAAPVLAQPETMDPVVLPVTPASIGSEVTAIGTTIMLVVFGVSIAFALAWKLFRRVKSAV